MGERSAVWRSAASIISSSRMSATWSARRATTWAKRFAWPCSRVTEGEDKPLKYPTLFNSADAAVITKMDIAEPCGFDRDLALRNINEIRPGIRIFETSAKTGAGMDEWMEFLTEQRTGRG